MDVPNLGNRGLDFGLLLLIGGVLLAIPFLQAGLEARMEKQTLDRAERFTPGESA